MTADRWQQIKSVLNDALEREGAQRTVFLDYACRGDDEMRQEVESLLVSEAELSDFMETPVFRILRENAEPQAMTLTPEPINQILPRASG